MYLPVEPSFVNLTFQNFFLSLNTGLTLDRKGYLIPNIKSVALKFGNSYLYHSDWIWKIAME
jgi:hypothetical protein